MDRSIFKSAEVGVRRGEQVSHPHNCDELYVSLEGRTTDVVNGQENKTLPLDVFVLTRDVVHGQINAADYRYCIFKLDIDALIAALGDAAEGEGFRSLFIIEPAMRRSGGCTSNMQIDPATAEYAELTARLLVAEGEGEVADAMLISLVKLISKRARLRTGDSNAPSDAVAQAVLYINSHYAERITLETLARSSGYSPRHFSRLFSASFGSSPMRYLSEVRLGRAKVLLSENRLSVIEIAAAVGIDDSSAFTKSFRMRYGMTPTEYRRRSIGL